MKCPYCNSSTSVTNSRSHNNDHGVWRRRKCKSCQAIWTTNESLTLTTTHNVMGSGTDLQPFSRDKLFISVFDSLAHHNDRLSASSALTDTIIGDVLASKSAVIDVADIKEISIRVLSAYDSTAGSVYKAFHSNNI